MLQITRQVDYSLIALTHLAIHPGERFSARELAGTYQVSRPLMANVLKLLTRGGIVRSLRGSKGGYELAADPEALTVGRVVELIEGPLQLASCIPGEDEALLPAEESAWSKLSCSVSSVCPVRHSVFKLHARIRDVLYGLTLADLAAEAGDPDSRPGLLPLATPLGSPSAATPTPSE